MLFDMYKSLAYGRREAIGTISLVNVYKRGALCAEAIRQNKAIWPVMHALDWFQKRSVK